MKRLMILSLLVLSIFIANNVNAEPNLTSILDTIYGNGNYIRVSDSMDQVWFNPNGSAMVDVKYAGWTHTLGYTYGATSKILFDVVVQGDYYNSPDWHPLNHIDGGYYFTWFDQINKSSPIWSSVEALNGINKYDHMITYLITGGASKGDYAIAWEDQDLGDADYNDLVVQVHGVHPTPEPATMLLLGSGLVGLAGLRNRFKKA